MQQLASIDIGTNSTLLLIAEYNGKSLTPIYNGIEITRLGQGVGKTGRFHPDAMERTFNTLRHFQRICQEHGITEVVIGGTSAMRDATNGSEFIARVKSELGWEITILTGDDEARLTFLATQQEFSEMDNDLFVVDIGGGSTEFIAGNSHEMRFRKSLDVGTVRFTEQFISNDPPGEKEILIARQHIRKQLQLELNELDIASDRTTFIGVAGTVTTLLAVEKRMEQYHPEEIHKQPLTIIQMNQLYDLFCSMPLEERKNLPGLQPKRADVITMGTVILQEIMSHFQCSELLVSDRGVRYGLLYDYLRSQSGSSGIL